MVDPEAALHSWQTRTIVRNMFPLLIVLSLIVLWAGIAFDGAEAMFEEYALLAVMVPTMIGMGGNLGAILASRLTTQMHLGTVEFTPRDRVLWLNIGVVLALATTIFVALGLGAWIIGIVIGAELGLDELLLISMTSGLSVTIIAIVSSILVTYGSYRLGVDPDDTTVPIVTNVVDVLGMLIFVAVAGYVVGY